MINIGACYRIIVDCFYAEEDIDQIVKKLGEAMHTSIALIFASGKIWAYYETSLKYEKMLEAGKYISLLDFDKFISGMRKISDDLVFSTDRYWVMNTLTIDGRNQAFCFIELPDAKSQEDLKAFRSVLNMLSQYLYRNFPVSEKLHRSSFMREAVAMNTFLDRRTKKEKEYEESFCPDYLMVLCHDDTGQTSFHFLRDLKENLPYIYKQEKDRICFLFYNIKDSGRDTISAVFEKNRIRSCISDIFHHLDECPDKYEMLGRLSMMVGYGSEQYVTDEKENYLSLMFMRAVPLLTDMGLTDPGILKLMIQDAEKNTNLYETLRAYVICGGDLSETAQFLHLHRNSLVYRIKQISKLLNKDLYDHHVLRSLQAYILMFEAVQ